MNWIPYIAGFFLIGGLIAGIVWFVRFLGEVPRQHAPGSESPTYDANGLQYDENRSAVNLDNSGDFTQSHHGDHSHSHDSGPAHDSGAQDGSCDSGGSDAGS